MSSTRTRDTSPRIPIISCLPTALSPPSASAALTRRPQTPRRRQKASAVDSGAPDAQRPRDGSDTLTQGMRNLNFHHKGSREPEQRTLDTTGDVKTNKSLPQTPVESAKPSETNHITAELSPKRQRVNGFTSRCSLIASGNTALSPRRSRIQISAWSTDTSSAGSSSQSESLDCQPQDSDNVFQAPKNTISSPQKRPEYRVLLDNGLSIGCPMSSNSAYSMLSAPNSPATCAVAGKGLARKVTAQEAGVNK